MAKIHKLKKKKTSTRSKRTPAFITVDCIPVTQAGVTMYSFALSAKELWNIVEVNRRIEDKRKGYQRALSASRVRKIAKFIDDSNAIPGSILVSFDEAIVLANGFKLKIPNNAKAGWVIDGQHRLAGAFEANDDIIFPTVAFVKLPIEDQINYFVTINREQKGVPSSLYFDLLQYLPRKKSEKEMVEERANDLVGLLKRDSESPFFQRIVVTTSPRKGQISSTNFIRKIAPHIKPGGRLFDYSDDERAGILNNYYRALLQTFPDHFHDLESVFFKTVGFGALINVLPTILDTTFRVADKTSFKLEHVSNALKLVDDFDFEAWKQLGTGTAAENQAANDFRTKLTDVAQSSLGGLIELD